MAQQACTGRERVSTRFAAHGRSAPEVKEASSAASATPEPTGHRYIALADAHNEPGVLTTFAAYEYSPTLPDSGKHHRNVLFNGTEPARRTRSRQWTWAMRSISGAAWNKTCTGDCDFLTIPHNMNKGPGVSSTAATPGMAESYDDDGLGACASVASPWPRSIRSRALPSVRLGVGATDEECAFGQVLEPCEQGEETGCAFETGFSRQGLKIGLELGRELGFNPLAFGMIGSTDTHNGNPGDAEEWDFVGKVGLITSPAVRRLRDSARRAESDPRPYQSVLQFHTSGGLGRGMGGGEHPRCDLLRHETPRGVRHLGAAHDTCASSQAGASMRVSPGSATRSPSRPREGFRWAVCCALPRANQAASPTFYVAAQSRLDERTPPARPDHQGLDRRGREDPREGAGHRLFRWPRGRLDYPALSQKMVPRSISKPASPPETPARCS